MILRSSQLTFDIEAVLRQHDPACARHRYFAELMKENERLNLVSRETSPRDLDRLMAESLLPLAVLSSPVQRYLDIGSGGGFPAVPFLMCGVVGPQAVLVERTQKKAAALRRIMLALDLKAHIMASSFEQTDFADRFDLVTVRLVRLTPALLARIRTVLSSGGRLVYYATPKFECDDDLVQTFTYSAGNAHTVKSFTVFSKA
ncbi:MAG TPA: RsmG family class I SAM-dependent methyltransferase [Acidobacteriota bacterium]|nr:RsmG family class I SAM-dependent methyltransferase [Acidobacteriota bacterium]